MSGRGPVRVPRLDRAGDAPATVAVYVPLTLPALAELVAEGVAARAGTLAWADTPALRAALATPGAPAGGPEPADPEAVPDAAVPDAAVPDAGELDADELAESLLAAAADASLGQLAAAPAGAFVPALRVVVVCELRPSELTGGAGRPGVAGDGHPAQVRLAVPASWSRVASVMADDESAVPVVVAAVRRLRAGAGLEAVAPSTDDLALSWYDASEVGLLLRRQGETAAGAAGSGAGGSGELGSAGSRPSSWA